MLVKRAATLQETLGLRKAPTSGTEWHRQLLDGLPYTSLRKVAKAVGLKEQELVSHVGLKGPQAAARKRARKLHAPESDAIYAIALAYVRLAAFMPLPDAREWLKSPCVSLKDERPLDLLRTRLGTEYVMTAIKRMRPTPTLSSRARDEAETEQEDEAELA